MTLAWILFGRLRKCEDRQRQRRSDLLWQSERSNLEPLAWQYVVVILLFYNLCNFIICWPWKLFLSISAHMLWQKYAVSTNHFNLINHGIWGIVDTFTSLPYFPCLTQSAWSVTVCFIDIMASYWISQAHSGVVWTISTQIEQFLLKEKAWKLY